LFDANERAVIFLDHKGRVLFANKAASALARAADGIAITQDGLTLANAGEQRRLARLIGAALTPSLEPGNGMMLAGRPSGQRPYSILVSPIRVAESSMAAVTPCVCLTITDPARQTLMPEGALRELFGLTPSEARLAVRLARGDALADAADELGLAYATVRAQLVAIFRKTHTNRQGELVHLLQSSVPASAAG
jgi:DNA-binding CsgD family transcriptional regulator